MEKYTISYVKRVESLLTPNVVLSFLFIEGVKCFHIFITFQKHFRNRNDSFAIKNLKRRCSL